MDADLSSLFKKKGKGKKNKKAFQVVPSELEKEPEEEPQTTATTTTTASVSIPEDSEWVNKDQILNRGIVLPEQLASTVEHETILDNVQEETAESRHAKKTLLKTIKKGQVASAAASIPVSVIEEKVKEPTTFSEKMKLKQQEKNDPKPEFPELSVNINGSVLNESAWRVGVTEEVDIEIDADENVNESEKNNKMIKKSNKFAGKKKHHLLN